VSEESSSLLVVLWIRREQRAGRPTSTRVTEVATLVRISHAVLQGLDETGRAVGEADQAGNVMTSLPVA
jgi:hypothetical protein